MVTSQHLPTQSELQKLLPYLTSQERERLDLLLTSNRRIDTESPPGWFHEGQLAIWASEAQDILALAGTQSGKTAIEAYWLLRELQRCKPFIEQIGYGKAIYAGPTMTLMESQVIPAFKDLFEDDLALGKLYSGNRPKFVFSKEGAKRLIGTDQYQLTVYFAYTSDSSNLESMTACCGVWDEAGQKENKVASFRAFNRRLKIARSQGYGRRLLGTTPYEFGWLKQMLHDKASRHHIWDEDLNRRIEKNGDNEKIEVFSLPSWMNPVFNRSEAEADKDIMPLWEWLMMYMGLFTKPAGAIYDCFDGKNKVIRGDVFYGGVEPPREWKRFLGVDFGTLNTAAILIAEEKERIGPGVWGSPTGRYIVYGVYYPNGDPNDKQPTKKAREHAENIAALLNYVRPTCFGGSHQEEGWRESFQLSGLWVREPEVNSIEVQINKTYAGFASGDLVVCEDLTKLIHDIENYTRKLDEDGEPIEGKIEDDTKYHRLAGLRYIASYIFREKVTIRTGKAYSA